MWRPRPWLSRPWPALSATILLLGGGVCCDLTKLSAQSSGLSVGQARRLGGDGYDGASAIAAQPSGGVVVVGWFEGVARFGVGEVDAEIRGSSSKGTSWADLDAFVASYDGEGDCRWVRRFGGAGADSADSVAVASSGEAITSTPAACNDAA